MGKGSNGNSERLPNLSVGFLLHFFDEGWNLFFKN